MAATVLPASASNATASGHATPSRWVPRLHRGSGPLAPALMYLAVRQASLLVLVWMSTVTGVDIRGTLTSWDGAWFLGLAAGGYSGVPDGLVDAFGARTPYTSLAFFPGYPALVAAVSWLPGIGVTAAAFAVTVGAGVVTAYGLVRLAETVPHGSRKAGLVLVALFAATPMSVVLSMTYSEALFCALAVWGLLGLLRRQWLLAGACSALAGLVRPTAVALIAAVGLAALVAVVAGRDGWRPWVAALLAPSGLVGYLAFVAGRTGRWDGWFFLQRQGWDTGFDGGYATVRFAWRMLTTAPSVLEVTTVWLLVGALALFALCVLDWRGGPAWPLLVYAAVVLALDLGSNGVMNSKARLLLPAFVLLVPVAIGLARRRTALLVLTITALAVFSAWFGSYALMVWPYAI